MLPRNTHARQASTPVEGAWPTSGRRNSRPRTARCSQNGVPILRESDAITVTRPDAILPRRSLRSVAPPEKIAHKPTDQIMTLHSGGEFASPLQPSWPPVSLDQPFLFALNPYHQRQRPVLAAAPLCPRLRRAWGRESARRESPTFVREA